MLDQIMKTKLTDTFIQKRKIPISGREEIFDAQVQGFGVRIGQRERSFFFIRRIHGEKTRFSLGQYPAVSLSEARAAALDILGQIKKGKDPRDQKRIRKILEDEAAENTFAKIGARFLTEYCQGKKTPLRTRTIQGYRWALSGKPSAAWASRPLASITDRDVVKVIDKYEQQGKFGAARLFHTYLRKFFNWSIGKRLIDNNVVRGVTLASEPGDFKRDRVLSISELHQVLDAIGKLADPANAFVTTLILCGQRRNETSLTKWSHLQLTGDAPIWIIPPENSKNHQAHDVPLPAKAVELFKRLPVLGEYVFTIDGEAPISGFSKIKARVDRILEESNIPHWTFHDLRRSCATGMADLGIGPHIIEAILNHVSGEKSGVAGIYNRSRYDAERRLALAVWCSHLNVGQSECKAAQK
jgi:integrase